MPENLSATTRSAIDYRLLVLVSLLLSLWLVVIDPIVNRDAITYLRAADAYLQNGFFASQQMYGRPLISVCFAIVHQLTGISLLHSGLILTSLFYALLCVAFVATVQTMGGNRRVQILAAVVILSHPMLNNYRSAIMRDPAYWAFILLAFRELLLFSRNSTVSRQLKWFGYISLASLFRFEGLFFVAFAPLSLLAVGHEPGRFRACLRLLALPLCIAAALSAALVIYQLSASAGDSLFPDIGQYIDRLVTFPEQFAQRSAATGQALLEFSARDDAITASLAGLAAVLALNILRALTWPYVFVLAWARLSRLSFGLRRSDANMINVHLVISLLYLGLFTLINQFMLERYSSIFVLFALLYLPFVLNTLWDKAAGKGKLLVLVLLVGMSLDSAHNTDYRKAFIRDAKDWLLDNTAKNTTVISNERYIAYFSERQYDWENSGRHNFTVAKLAARPDYWQNGDYMAIAVKHREQAQWQAFLDWHGLTETAVFDGGRRGKISIVKVPVKTLRN